MPALSSLIADPDTEARIRDWGKSEGANDREEESMGSVASSSLSPHPLTHSHKHPPPSPTPLLLLLLQSTSSHPSQASSTAAFSIRSVRTLLVADPTTPTGSIRSQIFKAQFPWKFSGLAIPSLLTFIFLQIFSLCLSLSLSLSVCVCVAVDVIMSAAF